MLKRLLIFIASVAVLGFIGNASAKFVYWNILIATDKDGNSLAFYGTGDDTSAVFNVMQHGVWPDTLALVIPVQQKNGDTISFEPILQLGYLYDKDSSIAWNGSVASGAAQTRAVATSGVELIRVLIATRDVAPAPYARIRLNGLPSNDSALVSWGIRIYALGRYR